MFPSIDSVLDNEAYSSSDEKAFREKYADYLK